MKAIQDLALREALSRLTREARVATLRMQIEAEVNALGLERAGKVVEPFQSCGHDLPVAIEQRAWAVQGVQTHRVEAKLAEVSREARPRRLVWEASDTAQVHTEEPQAALAIIEEMPERSVHEAMCAGGRFVQVRQIGQRVFVIEARARGLE